MGISVKTQKMLWGRAANRCSFPECRRELVIDATETDDEALVGDACHIVGDSVDGPRGNSPLTNEDRDKYNNLILMCKVHHKLIDDQTNEYSIENLYKMKSIHEEWVRESLQGYDIQRQRDEERYASIIEDWVKRSQLDQWENWTYHLLNAGQPCLFRPLYKELLTLGAWIMSRIWPKRYPELEAAFNNFRYILADLLETFAEYIDQDYGDPEVYVTEKFYRHGYGNYKLERKLQKQYANHVNLVQDLTFELTRAANYICDNVRNFVFPGFRLQEGALIVRLDYVFYYHQYRVEYLPHERIPIPYPGIDKFKVIRADRDLYIGDTKDFDCDEEDENEDNNQIDKEANLE